MIERIVELHFSNRAYSRADACGVLDNRITQHVADNNQKETSPDPFSGQIQT